MAQAKKADSERRSGQKTFREHYANLTGEQVDKVYALTKMGFELEFVRTISKHRRLAVLRRDDELVSVNHTGECNFSPQINLRSDS
ncbi:hypothetical protein [Pseudoalteromonas ruthenica]|uniref:hypothetical protein n=1 Tax=Pseudoalteromonas ruthenica TaxID=151081 RepID=UPI00110AA60B|nr:hypothetical protein [Pseudoalteromonas ruthenica]TMO48234.1 hypothetical protein CWC24_04630 [Pseudoalteromonas ruthenica]TMO52037.1 hypothetical protein CWC23_03715 [Pseudoalteromonas ruthenica]